MAEEKREFTRIFVEIDEENNQINYYRESWKGPKVHPSRFHPSRLVKLIEKKVGKTEWANIPDPFDLGFKAPKDEKINAYILGDECSLSVQRNMTITEAAPGPDYECGEYEESHGGDEGVNMGCVTYCCLSQRDLEKEKPKKR